MFTFYKLKQGFQNLLRPTVHKLNAKGISANQVTLAAAAVSIMLGGLLSVFAHVTWLFILLPVWMFLRMALNAIDGMLAREHDQQTPLGAYLNELCDVIADAALFLPFAFAFSQYAWLVLLIIFLATLSEMTGVLGLMVGAERRYDGPMGKSDRAFAFGALGLAYTFDLLTAQWVLFFLSIVALLTALTIANRIQQGIRNRQ
uniref:CDP-alcohol phosphatidyltransferase family protein n=1 Tax=Thaumasiovibrio occultus TaxID=1891184 RepID=UPI000B35C254|nr:CDP-alcohol phosphatidyltransferase family protein [Thaumasiovibrio occultus]